MTADQVTEDNLKIVLDWLDSMRTRDPDRFAERLAPDLVWWDVSGSLACRGREEVLEWLRASAGAPPERSVEALELVATSEHVVLGIRDPKRRELAGVALEGQLFVVFSIRDGVVVELRDYPRRADALRPQAEPTGQRGGRGQGIAPSYGGGLRWEPCRWSLRQWTNARSALSATDRRNTFEGLCQLRREPGPDPRLRRPRSEPARGSIDAAGKHVVAAFVCAWLDVLAVDTHGW
jgi:ketosteroid isomerase-like protein